MDKLEQLELVTEGLPLTNAEIRAWLLERGVFPFAGAQTVFHDILTLIATNLDGMTVTIDCSADGTRTRNTPA